MSVYKTLEHREHAEHMAHGGGHGDAEHGPHEGGQPHANPAQWSALLVAFLAAGLALSEQGAKHAEIKVQQLAVDAADAWAQYQAKSIRTTVARDVSLLITGMDPATDQAAIAHREQLMAELKRDQERYRSDPHDGMEAIAHRAHEFEHERDHALEQTHAYHNGSASLELGIVLATASAIMRSRLLLFMSLGLGVVGGVVAVLGYFAPEYGAF